MDKRPEQNAKSSNTFLFRPAKKLNQNTENIPRRKMSKSKSRNNTIKRKRLSKNMWENSPLNKNP
jgi:hypothetical protein